MTPAYKHGDTCRPKHPQSACTSATRHSDTLSRSPRRGKEARARTARTPTPSTGRALNSARPTCSHGCSCAGQLTQGNKPRRYITRPPLASGTHTVSITEARNNSDCGAIYSRVSDDPKSATSCMFGADTRSPEPACHAAWNTNTNTKYNCDTGQTGAWY